MLRIKTPAEQATESINMAQSFELVWYRNSLYVPTHFATGNVHPSGDPEETYWETMDQRDVRVLAKSQYLTLFKNDSDLRNFHFMVMQSAREVRDVSEDLLIKTEDGLRLLNSRGELEVPDGRFVANTLKPELNTNEAAKQEVWDTIVNWLGSETEATSLLHHLATVLAPGWSAVKYVLLIGEGRNGKGVLLGMLDRLFGKENMSQIPRQEIAGRKPMVIELNGKLINLVMDGSVEYIKDSGPEKTLVAGEPLPIKDLYVSAPVTVQTNALFVEALNKEPMSRDKSSALQKRLARFYFNNVYELDKKFERHMWSDDMLGAFLALLIDHYVLEEEAAEKLALTEASQELQMEHMLHNSLALQYLKQMFMDGTLDVIDEPLDAVAKSFIVWRGSVGDKSSWDMSEAIQQLEPVFEVSRKSKRINGRVTKIKIIDDYKGDAKRFIDSLEVEDEAGFAEMVDE